MLGIIRFKYCVLYHELYYVLFNFYGNNYYIFILYMEKIRYYYYKLFNRKKYRRLLNKQKEKNEDIKLSERILNNYFKKSIDSNYREFEVKNNNLVRNINNNPNYKRNHYFVKNDKSEIFRKLCVLETELADNLFLPELIDIKLNEYSFEISNKKYTICSWKYNEIFKFGIIGKFVFINIGRKYLNSGYVYLYCYNKSIALHIYNNLNNLFRGNIIKIY